MNFENVDIKTILISVILTFVLTFIFRDVMLKLLREIGLCLKNKFFSNEQILGKYFGYYLHKDTPGAKLVLRESNWKISADYKKGHYIITIYKNSPNKKIISYKGKMWAQGNHYLLQFDSKTYEETVFERRIQVTKCDEYPIVGIGLAVTTQGKKIRANISVLSKRKLSLEDFQNIVKDYNFSFEEDAYNLKINA